MGSLPHTQYTLQSNNKYNQIYITLQSNNKHITTQPNPTQHTSHYITLHHIPLHHITYTLHFITFHHITSHYFSPLFNSKHKQVLSLNTHPYYLYRMTTLFAVAVLSPAVNAEIINNSMLPLVLKMSKDPVPNIR